jgi:hypothetical protein
MVLGSELDPWKISTIILLGWDDVGHKVVPWEEPVMVEGIKDIKHRKVFTLEGAFFSLWEGLNGELSMGGVGALEGTLKVEKERDSGARRASNSSQKIDIVVEKKKDNIVKLFDICLFVIVHTHAKTNPFTIVLQLFTIIFTIILQPFVITTILQYPYV